jgi:hypothetical protein
MQINWIGEIFDTIVSLTGKYGRWLNTRGKRISFLIAALNCVYWMLRDFYIGFYSQGFFCLISIGLHLYGYWYWGKNRIGENDSNTRR